MKRTVAHLVALVAVVWKHYVGRDQVALAKATTVEDSKRLVLVRTREGAPEARNRSVRREGLATATGSSGFSLPNHSPTTLFNLIGMMGEVQV
jgi:hypothetical protein